MGRAYNQHTNAHKLTIANILPREFLADMYTIFRVLIVEKYRV